MKKFLSLLIVISLIFVICTPAFAEEFQTKELYGEKYYITDADGEKRVRFTYDVENGEATINDVHIYKGSAVDLVFPAEIEGYPVKKVENISVAKEVSHKEGGVTYSELTEDKIKSVTFEKGIESLYNVSISHCKNLTDVTLADSIKSVEKVYFNSLPELVSAELGNGLEYAHYFGIADCPKLENINIPKSLKYTAHGFMFARCPSLESVIIPEGLEGIPQECFYGCTGLKNVVIGNGMQTIDEGAFAECTALEKITLPNSVTVIEKYAFAGCGNLKQIKMSDNITYIGEKAFCGTGLESMELPKKLTEIGEKAFLESSLKQITIPSSVKNISRSAFASCKELKKLTISDKTTVYPSAFGGCLALDEVTVEGKMSKSLFEALNHGAPYIQKYYDEYDGDFVIFDGNYLAKYKGTDRNPVIPEGVTELGGQAFHGADIDSVTFPSTEIDEIPSHCFQGSKIKELTIPGTVKNVRDYAFYGCYNLEKLTIESGVKSVSDNAFINCSSLSEDNVNIAKGVFVGKEAFKQTPLDKEWMVGQEIEATPKPTTTPLPSDKPVETPTPKKLTVNTDMSIKVNDNEVNFPDAKPFIDENDRTQIPIRAVAEMLGCEVDWNGTDQSIIITLRNGNDSRFVTMQIGSAKYGVTNQTDTQNSDMAYAHFEGVHEMDTVAVIKDDRTYVPIRFVAEAMGLTVEWEQ